MVQKSSKEKIIREKEKKKELLRSQKIIGNNRDDANR